MFGIFFTAIPMVFIGIGANLALQQDSKIHTFRPVQVTIDSSEVKTTRGSKGGSTYSPDVTYEYDVDGAHYTSSQTLVSSLSTSDYNWAEGIVNRYHQGQKAEAYFNPFNPGDAFLVKEHSFFPYFFILFPMIHLTIGQGAILAALGYFGVNRPIAIAQTDGWYQIQPDVSITNRRKFALLACLWWYGVGGFTLGHFFYVTENRADFAFVLGGSIYCALGLISLIPAIRWSLILHELADPIVRMPKAPLQHGELTDVEVTLKTNSELRIRDVQVGLLCQQAERQYSGGAASTLKRMIHEKWETISENKTFRSDQKFKVEAKVQVPENDPNPSVLGSYTNKWMIGVKVNIEKGTSYFGKFPIDVL